jgi:hypothetical protein
MSLPFSFSEEKERLQQKREKGLRVRSSTLLLQCVAFVAALLLLLLLLLL